MVVRLVPHKSQRYRYTEATGVVVTYGIFGTIGRELEFYAFHQEPPVYVLQIATAMIPTLLFFVASNYWARWHGAEMVTFPESVKRGFRERASMSRVEYAARYALYFGSYGLVSFLLLLRISDWPYLVPITVAWLMFGFIGGMYGAQAAHVAVRAEEARAAGEEVRPVPFSERAYRHYLGYAVGLTLALLVATALSNGEIAAIAVTAAFIVGKVVADFTRPQPAYIYSAQTRRHWWRPFYTTAFGLVWWGVPLSPLFFVLVGAFESDPQIADQLAAVVAALMLGAVWAFLIWLVMLAVRWGPTVQNQAAS
jgi:hypothetical protein